MLFLALLLGALAPRPARAADWGRRLPPEAVASHVGTAPRGVLVAAAGTEGDAAPVAQALREALRQGGRVPLVMGTESLGDVQGLGDAAIVRHGASLPIDVVVVARVIPGAPGTETALLAFYDRQGAMRSSASLGTDQILAPRSPEEPPAASPAPARPTPPDRSEYDQLFIGFEEIIGVNQAGTVVLRRIKPTEGIYRRPLGGVEFYEKVGRPDLAARYQARRRASIGLLVLGPVTGAAGVGMLIGGVMKLLDNKASPQDHARFGQIAVAGGVLTGVGMLAGLAGGILLRMSHPVSEHEMRALGDRYNRGLQGGRPAALREVLRRASLWPVLGPQGGGMVAQLLF